MLNKYLINALRQAGINNRVYKGNQANEKTKPSHKETDFRMFYFK